MYLYFIIGIIIGILTLLLLGYGYDFAKIRTYLIFIIPNIILWPIVIGIGLCFYIMRLIGKEDKAYKAMNKLINEAQKIKDEEGD